MWPIFCVVNIGQAVCFKVFVLFLLFDVYGNSF
jgi:hypothetical protein